MIRIFSFLFLFSILLACNPSSKLKNKDIEDLEDINLLLQKVRSKYNMPAMAAAVVRKDAIQAIGVTGVRRIYTKDKVKLSDRFHMGSTTKAITAHWAASLVESGFITWDSKILDIFPHWEDDALKTYHNVTLSDLLCHRGKIQPFTSAMDLASLPRFAGNPMEKRRAFAKWLLKQNPAKVGSQEGYVYSNAGYSIAAAMLEKVSETTWEEAILSDVLVPLDIDAVIGWPTDSDANQPFGHHSVHPLDSNLRAVTARNMFQMEDIIAPSGDLSMSIEDYAKFVQAHLQGVQGQDNLLKADTYNYVHYGRENYAMGWTRLLKNGTHVSTHDGSAGTFYSHTSILKEKDLGIIIFVNASNIYATKAVYTLKKRLLDIYDK
ncbi:MULTISPECIES: serine hydrolase [unclassified Aureispira]|uniref:serine hydrolase domain-containing protein n=1 Tax=unclassified Aureispira TaxID=2649989 RepID=UPI0006962782|nr:MULTISPECIES: serine hydrolase domain-containing protein [unclassified Aureispira]WMX15743.1 serine hydrolase domain-containing protein [Aureispira sp. CCB-E]